MAFISMGLTIIIVGLIYMWMIKKEVPDPIGKGQAIVPIALGVASLILSFIFVLGLSWLFVTLGYSAEGQPLVLQSIIGAFVVAGLPEELAKFIMIFVTLLIFRSSVRNVYEYVLIGAAVGFGFSVFEEFLYGGDLITFVFRLVLITLHVIFGIVMGYHLGMAKHKKVTGKGSVGMEYFLAFLTPIAMHTLFDACTATNKFLSSNSEDLQLVGIILGIAAAVVMFVIQILTFVRIKKKAETLSSLSVLPQDKTAEVVEEAAEADEETEQL